MAEKDETKKIDFVLYKVQFEPFKFNLWNTWYKRVAKKLLGTKRAYWLFYRKALTVSYTGKAFIGDTPRERPEPVGRLRSGS